jgi:hypothetical protein
LEELFRQKLTMLLVGDLLASRPAALRASIAFVNKFGRIKKLNAQDHFRRSVQSMANT